ncbi:hypothetical protein [Alloacidobacterium sp.]|uniref:hypothetical protein n=1 Tax=Alloacidobacterium sp. TaxID=2951999 RepID=UPI002D56BD87|nr:hypothetical protein [Alloacidobacterium sp.]HYK34882.1 hypothetical protein [Alloacidobacterium sp.]
MPIKSISRIALLLAVALTAGCHKTSSNTQNPPAAIPATTPDQTQSTATAQAGTPTAAPSTAQPATAAAQPAASSSTAAVPSAPDQPAPPQQAANTPEPAPLPEVPSGTVLSIRMNQTINVKHAAAGEPFSGTIVNPIVVDGNTVIPSGSAAEGEVVAAHKRGHFKGASVLQLRLTGMDVNGQHYRIDTSSITHSKKGKGKRSAAFIGGGSGLGMLIGGLATGGTGLLIGGLAGAGAGTGVAAFTGNKDITIPAESVVNFKLAEPVQLR